MSNPQTVDKSNVTISLQVVDLYYSQVEDEFDHPIFAGLLVINVTIHSLKNGIISV